MRNLSDSGRKVVVIHQLLRPKNVHKETWDAVMEGSGEILASWSSSLTCTGTTANDSCCLSSQLQNVATLSVSRTRDLVSSSRTPQLLLYRSECERLLKMLLNTMKFNSKSNENWVW